MSEEIVRQLLSRLSGAGHRGGAFGSQVLLAISRILPNGNMVSLETGCGKSTIMFSNLSKHHFVFAYDDRGMPDSSVTMVQKDKDFKADAVTFIYGPTQKTLPAYAFPEGTSFDVILIDGPHGYPFPDLEYALLYPWLKKGGILIIDDVHIPSIGHMFDTLREDRMYDEIGVFSTTGVLRRTEVDGVPADGDHWYEQSYNYSRFPLPMNKYRIDRGYVPSEAVDFGDKSNIHKYAVRGIEYVSEISCARTIDLSAVFYFHLPKIKSSKISVILDYRFVYADAAADAVLVLGENARTIPMQAKRSVEVFEFPEPQLPDLKLDILLPNARPEHDRGVNRYDFRRVGIEIYSICIRPAGVGTGTAQSPSLVSKFAAFFGRSRKP